MPEGEAEPGHAEDLVIPDTAPVSNIRRSNGTEDRKIEDRKMKLGFNHEIREKHERKRRKKTTDPQIEHRRTADPKRRFLT
jgi:hypothetical protein